jgi:hypothetical protein
VTARATLPTQITHATADKTVNARPSQNCHPNNESQLSWIVPIFVPDKNKAARSLSIRSAFKFTESDESPGFHHSPAPYSVITPSNQNRHDTDLSSKAEACRASL